MSAIDWKHTISKAVTREVPCAERTSMVQLSLSIFLGNLKLPYTCLPLTVVGSFKAPLPMPGCARSGEPKLRLTYRVRIVGGCVEKHNYLLAPSRNY